MAVRQMSRSALRQRSDEALELRDRRPNRHEMERALGVRRAGVHLAQDALSAVKIGDDAANKWSSTRRRSPRAPRTIS